MRVRCIRTTYHRDRYIEQGKIFDWDEQVMGPMTQHFEVMPEGTKPVAPPPPPAPRPRKRDDVFGGEI